MRIYSATVASTAFALVASIFHRAPVVTHYRIDTKSETSIDLSGVGQGTTQNNFDLVSWISVSLSDSAGGRALSVRVDSMKYQNGTIPQLGQQTADSAKGGRVQGFIDGSGRVKGLTASPDGNVLLADLQGVLNGLFPRVKVGVKPGDGWSDTVEVVNTSSGSNIKSNFVIDYSVAGLESSSGRPALKVNSTTKAKLTGTMQNPAAGTMDVEGTVKGDSQFLVTPEGLMLGGTSHASSDQFIKVAQVPTPIPVKTVRTVTVTLVP